MIAVAISNCQVLEQWGRGSDLADQARARLEAIPQSPAFAALMDEMLERKAKVFSQDMRAISDFKVRRTAEGELSIVAEGRLPSELMREHLCRRTPYTMSDRDGLGFGGDDLRPARARTRFAIIRR